MKLIPCKCIRESGCLFLPPRWAKPLSWIGTGEGLDQIGVMLSHKVYFTKHGPLWKDLDENVYRLYNFTGHSSIVVVEQNRWYSRGVNQFIMAENLDYYELLLTDMFLP